MKNQNLEDVVALLKQKIGSEFYIRIKHFYLGKNKSKQAVIFYLNNFVNKDIINRDILAPLMTQADARLNLIKDKAQFLCRNYICSGGTTIESDIDKAADAVKSGSTVLIVEDIPDFIVIDTSESKNRSITDPANEASIKGSRESFVENIDVNLSLLKRKIKDKNFKVESSTVGKRSQTKLALAYIEDIVDNNALNELRTRIHAIDVDYVSATGMVEQLIEKKTYSIFPQFLSTERPDRVLSSIMSGKIAIILDGNSTVITAPSVLYEFFQAVDDYYNRTIVANALRFLRILATIIVLLLPAFYLSLLKFNCELIPVDFIVPIVQARSGISLTPFFEILTMEILVEFLREGGLRLPSKVAPTLSLVGGIIIGDAAVQSKIVSPTTLLVVGVTVVSSFLIPNYEMSLSLRFLRFFILFVTNFMGMLGISAVLIFLLVHLSSLDSLGVPYMTFYKSDLKDTFIRVPLWQMNKRPSTSSNTNPIRQKNFRKDFIDEKNKSDQ